MLKPLSPATAHLTEEMLEEYRFGRLSQGDVDALEEHLLICLQCCETLKKIDEFASAVRMYATLPASAAVGRPAWARGVGMGAIIAAAALGLTVAAIHPASRSAHRAPVVPLTTFRGGDGATIPAQSDAILSLDLAGLTPEGAYRVQIVDGQGEQVWTGQSRALDGELKVRVSSGLRPGAYWIRLYSQDELVREFGLRAQ